MSKHQYVILLNDSFHRLHVYVDTAHSSQTAINLYNAKLYNVIASFAAHVRLETLDLKSDTLLKNVIYI